MIFASGIMYKAWVVTMMSLMTLLRFMTWILIYLRNALLYHLPVIIFVYWYTLVRKISMSNTYRREWVPIYLCKKERCSSLKGGVPDLINLIVIWYIIVVLWFSSHTVLTGLPPNVPGYESSLEMMLAHICTGHRRLDVLRRVTVAFLTPFLCVLNIG